MSVVAKAKQITVLSKSPVKIESCCECILIVRLVLLSVILLWPCACKTVADDANVVQPVNTNVPISAQWLRITLREGRGNKYGLSDVFFANEAYPESMSVTLVEPQSVFKDDSSKKAYEVSGKLVYIDEGDVEFQHVYSPAQLDVLDRVRSAVCGSTTWESFVAQKRSLLALERRLQSLGYAVRREPISMELKFELANFIRRNRSVSKFPSDESSNDGG